MGNSSLFVIGQLQKTPFSEVKTEVLLVCHTSATNEQSKGPELMIKHIIRGVGACRIY